jgi:hypothetical protein
MKYAEQYIEVVRNDKGKWDVELVIEFISNGIHRTIIQDGFETPEEGDMYAQPLRLSMDKTIFNSEIN